MNDLTEFFTPDSVVIVGASNDPNKIAGRPLAAMLTAGYAGNVYVVNPRHPTVQGQAAYESVQSLPEVPGMAIICLPAAPAVEAVAQCAAAGVKYAVVFAGGFAETGSSGRQMQEAMRKAAQASGMRLLGPNTLGAMDFGSHLIATFTRAADDKVLSYTSGLALVSQSGALGNYVLTQANDLNLPITKWVATGNEADIESAEMIETLASDPSVRGILVYLEGARNGDRLHQALALAQRNRVPVAMIKVGATDVGARAIVSHTDALAGDDAAYEAVLRRYGVRRVNGIEPLLDLGIAMTRARPVNNRRVLLATVSGGVGVIMAEDAVRSGLLLPALSDTACEQLRKALPFTSPANPLDVTGQVVQDFSLLETALTVGLADTNAATTVCFIGRLARMPDALARYWQTISQLQTQYPQTLFVTVGMFSANSPGTPDQHMIFMDPSRAIAAVAALADWGAQFDNAVDNQDDAAIGSFRQTDPGHAVNEAQAYAILRDLGISVPEHMVADSSGAAVDAWKSLGEVPVVMKALSAQLAHKSDIGGVALNLSGNQEVAEEFASLLSRVNRTNSQIDCREVLIVPMLPIHLELFIAARVDPELGPVMLVGAGGQQVEVLKDVQIRCAPVNSVQASEMIAQLRCWPLLGEWRGRDALDTSAVVKALVLLSHFALANRDWLKSIEINPLVPGFADEGAIAMDCVIQRRGKNTDA